MDNTAMSHLTRREPIGGGLCVLRCTCGFESEPEHREVLSWECPRDFEQRERRALLCKYWITRAVRVRETGRVGICQAVTSEGLLVVNGIGWTAYVTAADALAADAAQANTFDIGAQL